MEPELNQAARSRRAGILLVSGAVGYIAAFGLNCEHPGGSRHLDGGRAWHSFRSRLESGIFSIGRSSAVTLAFERKDNQQAVLRKKAERDIPEFLHSNEGILSAPTVPAKSAASCARIEYPCIRQFLT